MDRILEQLKDFKWNILYIRAIINSEGIDGIFDSCDKETINTAKRFITGCDEIYYRTKVLIDQLEQEEAKE